MGNPGALQLPRVVICLSYWYDFLQGYSGKLPGAIQLDKSQTCSARIKRKL